MDMEPELEAMNNVFLALKDLEDDAKQRVISWAIGRFSLSAKPTKTPDPFAGSGETDEIQNKDFTSFDSAADVFSKANVKHEPDKVLVIASYLQQKNGSELTGREINKELIHLGHGVGNITNAITSLIKRKPKLMIQTRKEGKSKQAQKKYKVTGEGIKSALKMISDVQSEIE